MFFNLQVNHNAPFGASHFFFGLLVFLIIIMFASSTKNKKLATPGNEHYKYYLLNIYFKIFFAIVYGAIYLFYYKGGDTMAYWSAAQKLNNLFWESPSNYWKELWEEPTLQHLYQRYNSTTGYPPGWIYRDGNSFFVSKIISVFMIFLGQSYFVLTIIFGYISAKASWKVFELVHKYNITSMLFAALSILFIPSVAFWCSGLSKDTVVLISVFYVLHYMFGLANGTINRKSTALFAVFCFGFVLYTTRTFMLFTVLAPLLLAMSTRVLKNYRDSFILLNAMRLMIALVAVAGFLFFLRSQGQELANTANKYIEEASVQQDDFLNNEAYGDKRYDLGTTDFSPFGMVRAAPLAIFTGIYRPGLWEARSPLLIISGLETSFFIYLTFLFIFKGKIRKKIHFIRVNEFLVFSLLFAIILAFFAGFTSILFGVLVRIKAPLLPFFLIVLTTSAQSIDTFKEKFVDSTKEN